MKWITYAYAVESLMYAQVSTRLHNAYAISILERFQPISGWNARCSQESSEMPPRTKNMLTF